ncbi:MAG: peptidoglycan recognition protein, partial [Actinobacteria bacterium]|nr:peptidoglycan recognition protein [Actinomycetota bacterium]
SIRRASPSYAPDLRLALVHHTAGSNGYSQAESPAIVRAIQIYHVKGNGWNDIGYNFLVDRFGQVFEGRFGGIERNVIGAHAQGFNTGSVGVSVIGEYSSLTVSAKARDALERLLAWRLDVAHLDPATALTFTSGGNPRFPAGIPVFLRAVSGHRDTGFTDCPGNRLYGILDAVAGNVSRIGLPKLYAPTVTGMVPGPVRFRARLSAPLPWTIDVQDEAGRVVASTAGLGSTVDWTWDASFAPAGAYSYAIRGGAEVFPAVGVIGAGALQLGVSQVAADPPTVTPNGDGDADAATIRYSLTVPAVVTAVVRNVLGEGVATVAQGWRRAAQHQLRFDPAALPDGVYDVEVGAQATGGRTASASVRVVVTRTLGRVSATREEFSPNGDGRADGIAFRFELAAFAEVRLRVLKEGKWIATLLAGSLEPGPQTVEWDGRKRFGKLLDGAYQAVLEVTDSLATVTVVLPFASDTRRPQVRVTQRFPLRIWVSEPALLTVRAGGRSLVQDARAAGVARIPNAPRRGPLRAVAWDAAGNVSLPAIRR